jgi:hypothetical protein
MYFCMTSVICPPARAVLKLIGAMKNREAATWQILGGAAWAIGAFVLAEMVRRNGIDHTSPVTLYGATGSAALMLIGTAGIVTGRVLQIINGGYRKREALLWRILAAVCCGGGAIPVLNAYADLIRHMPTLNDVAMAMAGSFHILAGVTILAGQRVMDHVRLTSEAQAQ